MNRPGKKQKLMEKVKIKRIKRNQKPVSRKEKLLAGLGVGSTLLGLGAAGKPATQARPKPIVRTRDTGKSQLGQKVKKELKEIFGIPEAKAFDTYTGMSIPDINAMRSGFYGSQGTPAPSYSELYGSSGTSIGMPTGGGNTSVMSSEEANYANNIANPPAQPTEAATDEQTGGGSEGDAYSNDGTSPSVSDDLEQFPEYNDNGGIEEPPVLDSAPINAEAAAATLNMISNPLPAAPSTNDTQGGNWDGGTGSGITYTGTTQPAASLGSTDSQYPSGSEQAAQAGNLEAGADSGEAYSVPNAGGSTQVLTDNTTSSGTWQTADGLWHSVNLGIGNSFGSEEEAKSAGEAAVLQQNTVSAKAEAVPLVSSPISSVLPSNLTPVSGPAGYDPSVGTYASPVSPLTVSEPPAIEPASIDADSAASALSAVSNPLSPAPVAPMTVSEPPAINTGPVDLSPEAPVFLNNANLPPAPDSGVIPASPIVLSQPPIIESTPVDADSAASALNGISSQLPPAPSSNGLGLADSGPADSEGVGGYDPSVGTYASPVSPLTVSEPPAIEPASIDADSAASALSAVSNPLPPAPVMEENSGSASDSNSSVLSNLRQGPVEYESSPIPAQLAEPDDLKKNYGLTVVKPTFSDEYEVNGADSEIVKVIKNDQGEILYYVTADDEYYGTDGKQAEVTDDFKNTVNGAATVYVTDVNESVKDFAERMDVPLDKLLEVNPGLSADGNLKEQDKINIPAEQENANVPASPFADITVVFPTSSKQVEVDFPNATIDRVVMKNQEEVLYYISDTGQYFDPSGKPVEVSKDYANTIDSMPVFQIAMATESVQDFAKRWEVPVEKLIEVNPGLKADDIIRPKDGINLPSGVLVPSGSEAATAATGDIDEKNAAKTTNVPVASIAFPGSSRTTVPDKPAPGPGQGQGLSSNQVHPRGESGIVKPRG